MVSPSWKLIGKLKGLHFLRAWMPGLSVKKKSEDVGFPSFRDKCVPPMAVCLFLVR